MKIAFDLDGTLDKEVLRMLALSLASAGHEVHIITGTFPESGAWQDRDAKYEKLKRLGFVDQDGLSRRGITVHVLDAVDLSFGMEYRLRDLGLRKGNLCERLGIEILIDDSEMFCQVAPAMCGDLCVLQVRR